MDKDKYIEVRCCCKPENLYGWLPKPQGLKLSIFKQQVRYLRECGDPIELTIDTFARNTLVITPESIDPTTERKAYPAIRSGDLPIEEFRNVIGFIENK